MICLLKSKGNGVEKRAVKNNDRKIALENYGEKMLAKICSKCGMRYKTGRCSCQKNRYKRYDIEIRNKESRAVYHDKKWERIRLEIKAKCQGLDLYQLHVKKRIVKATLVHHIVPLEDDMERAYDKSNLIMVSTATHALIHAAYDKSEDDKRRMQSLLFDLVNR